MKDSDYRTQADFVGKRFLSKGYTQQFVDKQIESVQSMDRQQMIYGEKKTQPLQEAPALVLDYNVQYKDIGKIFKKHWHILKRDRHLESILPDKPVIIYKRATTLQDLIVKNVVDPPLKNQFLFFSGKGFFPCKYCFACQHSKKIQGKKKEFQATSTGNIHSIKDFISCHTKGVVYVLQCSCKL